MDLKNLSDSFLLKQTEQLAKSELEILVQVLHHLLEIDRRKLFSALRYTSLFDYAVKKLNCSEDQACRRIAAMRLLRELPEVSEKISSGALTLTNIGMAQTLFRKEKTAGVKAWDRSEKLVMLEKMQNQTRRQAEKLVLQNSSSETILMSDKIRAVTESKIEITFVAPEELHGKIEHLKGLLAHKFPYLTLAELFDNLCELGLQKYDPCRYAPRAARVRQLQVAAQ